MGQHKFNPTAQAAASGELSKADRVPTPKTPTHTERLIVAGDAYHDRATIKRRLGRKVVTGYCLVRAIPKLRGKAAVKRAKRARQLQRAAA